MNTALASLLPKDIDTLGCFMGSKFENSEAEQIAANVVIISKNSNPNAWTPFSFDDYKKHCSHSVTDAELRVLETFVNGGKPVWNTTTILEPGYLVKDENGNYSVTEKFLEVLEEFKK